MNHFNCRDKGGKGDGFANVLSVAGVAKGRAETAVILVHGYKSGLENVLGAYNQIADNPTMADLDVFGFHWPSNNRVFAYWSDRKDARLAAAFLGESIAKLRRLGYLNVSLIAHSMGNRVVGELLELSERFAALYQPNVWVGHGADIAKRHMTGEGDYGAHAKRVNSCHQFYSEYDRVLGIIAPIALPSARVGRYGLPKDRPANFHEVDASLLTGCKIRHGDYKRSDSILRESARLILGAV